MGNQKKLIILDDLFPYLKSGFRLSEYNSYLERYPNSEVYTEAYNTYFEEYKRVYPQYKDRVKPVTEFNKDSRAYGLIYTIFINGVIKFFKPIQTSNTPFVFTLYPGGGFWLNDPAVDEKLVKAFSSPLFKKVIVTQEKTYEHIIENGFVTPDKVEMIYGMVTHPEYFSKIFPKQFYRKDKNTFDICFVSHKYMTRGQDKGYDTFINVCKKLAEAIPDVRFHVVGNYNQTDMDVKDIEDKLTFYGLQNMGFFQQFYPKMDMILSPNAPFILVAGKNFDGFPTGCCIDAALNGVGVFCTDALHQNVAFQHGKDMVIIKRDVEAIINHVMYYYAFPDKLYELSRLGQEKARAVFDFDMQIRKRMAVIDQAMQ